ncbi:MAG: hypothetical protein OXC69_03285 [Candidatus Tectomicrobia bacterium]|nr:hypothetical protein [Candidatus Tectomicrobia bacterium]
MTAANHMSYAADHDDPPSHAGQELAATLHLPAQVLRRYDLHDGPVVPTLLRPDDLHLLRPGRPGALGRSRSTHALAEHHRHGRLSLGGQRR